MGELDRWLDDNWQPSLTVREWWARLATAGYAHPTWPTGLGGQGMTSSEARQVLTVLARAGVVAPPTGHVASTLAAPTILAHGSDEQTARYIGPIARGEVAWCQLFSEPGAGSDLASLGTRAVLD